MVKVGDKVMRRPCLPITEREDERCSRKPREARVVYVHPQGRYHTVEFRMLNGTMRESYQGV